MSEADEIKEEIAWLKLIFAALIAVEVSLVGWLALNYTNAGALIVACSLGSILAVGAGIVWVNRAAFRRIRQLRNL